MHAFAGVLGFAWRVGQAQHVARCTQQFQSFTLVVDLAGKVRSLKLAEHLVSDLPHHRLRHAPRLIVVGLSGLGLDVQGHQHIAFASRAVGVSAPGHAGQAPQLFGLQTALSLLGAQHAHQLVQGRGVEEAHFAHLGVVLFIQPVERGLETAFEQDVHAESARGPLTPLVDQAVHGLQQLGCLLWIGSGADQVAQQAGHVAGLLGAGAAIGILVLAKILAAHKGKGWPQGHGVGAVVWVGQDLPVQAQPAHQQTQHAQSHQPPSFDKEVGLRDVQGLFSVLILRPEAGCMWAAGRLASFYEFIIVNVNLCFLDMQQGLPLRSPCPG